METIGETGVHQDRTLRPCKKDMMATTRKRHAFFVREVEGLKGCLWKLGRGCTV